MIVDTRAMVRFAMRALVIGALLGFGGLVGVAIAWRWPLNFAGAAGLVFLGYCLGRAHEGEIATRPTQMISSLPTAKTERSRRG